MKKKFMIALSASAALLLAGLGICQTCMLSDSEMSDQDLLVMENVLAVTETNDNAMVEIRGGCHRILLEKRCRQKCMSDT